MGAAHHQQEHHQAEESLVCLLARANHLLAEGFEEEVKWAGLSVTEWRVLAALSGREGIAMTELADLVLFKQPTLTKAIDRMERAQLVQRRTPSDDRRRTLVYLTERGSRISAPLLQRARQHESSLDRVLGEVQSRELKSALLGLIERLTPGPEEKRARRPARPGARDA